MVSAGVTEIAFRRLRGYKPIQNNPTRTFTPDGYTWRGTHMDSGKLVASSHDRGFVEGMCARHAASAIAEAT